MVRFCCVGHSGNIFHECYLPTVYTWNEQKEYQAHYALFFWARPAHPNLAPETHAVFTGTKTRAVRAQHIRMGFSDKKEMNNIYITYLLLI